METLLGASADGDGTDGKPKLRDVFANRDDDDWTDEEEEQTYSGGLGQLGSHSSMSSTVTRSSVASSSPYATRNFAALSNSTGYSSLHSSSFDSSGSGSAHALRGAAPFSSRYAGVRNIFQPPPTAFVARSNQVSLSLGNEFAPKTLSTTLHSPPKTGAPMGSLGEVGEGTWKGDYTSDLVILALSHGFRGIDTAGQRKHYREDHVGAALAVAAKEMQLPRSSIWLQTKFTPRSGQDWSHPELIPFAQEEDVEVQVRKSFAASLRNLHPWLRFTPLKEVQAKIEANAKSGVDLDDGVEYADKDGEAWVDSYVLHSPLTTLDRTLKVWSAMESFVQLGLVREIGVSNTYDADIFSAISRTSSIPPTVLQNRWHYTTGHDVALLSLLSPTLSPNDYKEGRKPVVYQPFWSLTGNPNLLASVEVQDLAIQKGYTPQQVVYAFLASGMNVPGLQVTVLSGTSNEEHMVQAVRAVEEAKDGKKWEEGELDRLRRVVYGE
uniref:NADP-dependent oxidoreductase domain-containing protein n=1 Tax=Kalmanozyma brasiliensis (strain GHG001) TaxID=1365824 RepID=V5ECR4_KALBG